MKIGLKYFCEKHPRSLIIQKRVNDPFQLWKENQNITLLRCCFHINKGFDHILLLNDGKDDDGRRKGSKDI